LLIDVNILNLKESTKLMRERLGDIAQIQFGLYSKPTEDGNVAYLQVKHFDDSGSLIDKVDSFLEINEKSEAHLLEAGNILLVGKGARNFAWTYESKYGPAVASSIFFVIKPDPSKVIPEFLTTLFNLPQTHTYFQTLGAGSSIPSIRKSELEAFIIMLPSLEMQQKAVEIKELHYQDIEISKKILSEKQKLFQEVIKNIIYTNHE